MKKILKITIVVFFAICILMNFNTKKAYADEKKEVENGIYRIKSAQDPNIVFDIEGASKYLGAGLGLWYNYYSMNQEFVLTKLNDGSFEIKARHSDYVLDVYNNSIIEGTSIDQYANFGQDNQKFYIEPTEDGYYNIRCKHSNLYLDVSEGAAKAGTKIKTYNKNNGITQKFILEKVEPLQGSKTIDSGCYQILLNSNSNMAVTIENASSALCGNVVLNRNNKGTYQRFNITYLNDGFYSIEAAHSGYLLDNYNDDKGTGTNIIQYLSNGGNNQKWAIQANSDGTYYIIAKSNELYLSAAASNADGTNIYGHSQALDEEFRKFLIVPIEKKKSEKVIEDSLYKIKSCVNPEYSLDIEGVSKLDGANLELWTNNSGENQNFYLKYENGYYTIIANDSKKAIDVYNGDIVPSTNVIQWLQNGQANQQWIIEKTLDGYYKICSRKSEMYLMTDNTVSYGSNVYVGAEQEDAINQKFIIEEVVYEPTKIEESSYKITPYLNTNKYVEVENSSTYNNTNILVDYDKRRKNQIFDIKYIDDDSFKIIACHSQKVLTVNSENVEQNTDSGAAEQLWKAHQNSDGSFYIKSNYNGMCLTIDGNNICVRRFDGNDSQKFFFKKITDGSSGVYGRSGFAYAGDYRGRDLTYYKYGCGENVYFATFAVHGFEDNWNWDGAELKYIADQFYNRLITDKDTEIAKNWTIYIFPTVNPDGLYYGYTNNGPGRTTYYSSSPTHQGIDINRSWQTESSYKIYTDSRNYNGTAGFQAYEASALRDFMISNKSSFGRTILIDLHGWENSLIGSGEILSYFANYFPNATKKYERYGQQYLISWGRAVLGAKVGLVELPTWISSATDVRNADLAGKYINACYDMLNENSYGYFMEAGTFTGTNSNIGTVNLNDKLDEFAIATAGAIYKTEPNEEQIEDYRNLDIDSGVYIIPGFEKKILEVINSVCENKFGVNESNFLCVKEKYSAGNKYDIFFEKIINSGKSYLFSNLGELYFRDEVDKKVTSNIYEFMDGYQTYDYAEYEDKMLIDIPKNENNKLENREIVDSLIELIEQK